MTNEELKKKICDIIAPYVSAYGDDERIADALIAAGIGDVSCLREHRVIAEYSLVPDDDNPYIIPNVPLRLAQLYSGEEVEKIVKERRELKDELRSKVEYIHEQDEVIKEYKHRAARAERAVYNLAYGEWQREGARRAICEKYAPSTARDYLDRAEKELAEEGKDE